jgi:uncharacterized protein YciI
MLVFHASITAADASSPLRAAHREAHLDHLLRLRAQGLVIGAGPAPDGRAAHVFYRVPQAGEVTRLIEADPYFIAGVWTGYALRSFSQFVEPWELAPPVTDGSRRATIVEGVTREPDMATFALIELRGAGRLAFGGFLEGRATLALLRTSDPGEAVDWLAETGFWENGSLAGLPLLYIL